MSWSKDGEPIAHERLSRLQRRILVRLWAEEARTRSTMAADHRAPMQALWHDKGTPELSRLVQCAPARRATKASRH